MQPRQTTTPNEHEENAMSDDFDDIARHQLADIDIDTEANIETAFGDPTRVVKCPSCGLCIRDQFGIYWDHRRDHEPDCDWQGHGSDLVDDW
jgi:hypothetical protein